MEELITPELVTVTADFKMEFNTIETKNENWKVFNQEIDIGETLLNILDEVRTLKNDFEQSDVETKQQIQTLKTEILRIKSKVKTLNTSTPPDFQILPKLPMNTLEDLKEFDDRLPLDNELRAELKKLLQRCDSKDYSVFLRDGLRTIVTDELAVNLTWRGTPEKPTVQRFTSIMLLRDICLSKFPNVNHADINRKCQQHFLHAKDRITKKKTTTASPKPTVTSTFSNYSHTVRPLTPDLLVPLPSPPSGSLPKLPFKTLQSLEEFDDQLMENSKLKKALKQYINEITEKDGAHFVRAAFRAMMTDEVAMQVTWRGTKEKQSIQEFTIFLVIKDVCYAKYREVTNSDIRKAGQQHFVHAKDRFKKKSNIKKKQLC